MISLTRSFSSALVISDDSDSTNASKKCVVATPTPVVCTTTSSVKNSHLLKVYNVLWAEAFSYLSLQELCTGVVEVCRSCRCCSAHALPAIFKRSAYGPYIQNFDAKHNFWRFPEVFIALRNEKLPALPE